MFLARFQWYRRMRGGKWIHCINDAGIPVWWKVPAKVIENLEPWDFHEDWTS